MPKKPAPRPLRENTPKPKPNPKRPMPRLPKPSYSRSPVEKLVDNVGKSVRRVPSDLAEGGRVVRGAVNTVKENFNKIKRGIK